MQVHTFGGLLVMFLVLGFVLEFGLRLCGSFGVHLVALLGFWVLPRVFLGCLLAILVTSSDSLRASLEILGLSWDSPGNYLGALGFVWVSLEAFLGFWKLSPASVGTLGDLAVLGALSGSLWALCLRFGSCRRTIFCLGRPTSTNVKCPREIGRESWVRV